VVCVGDVGTGFTDTARRHLRAPVRSTPARDWARSGKDGPTGEQPAVVVLRLPGGRLGPPIGRYRPPTSSPAPGRKPQRHVGPTLMPTVTPDHHAPWAQRLITARRRCRLQNITGDHQITPLTSGYEIRQVEGSNPSRPTYLPATTGAGRSLGVAHDTSHDARSLSSCS
jgi:hypothetical protein